MQCLERVFVKDQLLFEGTKTGALVYDGSLSTHTNGTGPTIIKKKNNMCSISECDDDVAGNGEVFPFFFK